MSPEQLPEDPYRTFGRMVAHIFALAEGEYPEAVPRAQEALHAFVGQASPPGLVEPTAQLFGQSAPENPARSLRQ